jgi:hypothetical protein
VADAFGAMDPEGKLFMAWSEYARMRRLGRLRDLETHPIYGDRLRHLDPAARERLARAGAALVRLVQPRGGGPDLRTAFEVCIPLALPNIEPVEQLRRLVSGDGIEQLRKLGLPDDLARQVGGCARVALRRLNPTPVPGPPLLSNPNSARWQEPGKQRAVGPAARRHCRLRLKHVRVRPGTQPADFVRKLDRVRRFLAAGLQCEVVVGFQGRESLHPETGIAVLDRVVGGVVDLATADEHRFADDGRLTMLLIPLTTGERKTASHSAPA